MSKPEAKVNIADFLKFRGLQNKPYPIPHQYFFTKMIYGDKGSSKSTIAMSVAGDVLINSYENVDNIMLPLDRYFANEKRFQVKGYDRFVSEENGEMYKESSNLVYDLTIRSLKLLISKKIKFDWVITDGYQRLAEICAMKMRYKNNIGAFAGVKPRTIWNERKLYVNEYFRLVKQVARYGVIFTSQNKLQETEDGTKKEPAWLGKLKDDTSTVIFTFMQSRKAGASTINSFYANVQNCKVSGISKQYAA